MVSQAFIDTCKSVSWANTHDIGSPVYPPITDISYHSLGDDSDSADPPRYSVSELEARKYYAGLPSNPKLVARTGSTPWLPPTGPEAYTVLHELRPVFGHKIIDVWPALSDKIVAHLDSAKVPWTSIDGVRVAIVEEAPGPVILWIGVHPGSISSDNAYTAALGCLALLEEAGIADVDVEVRESAYARLAGPALLAPSRFLELDSIDHRGPLTPALGLPLAGAQTPFVEGTGSLYMSAGGDSDTLLLITARHAVLPLRAGPHGNDDVATASWRHRVVHLGSTAFERVLRSIKVAIGSLASQSEYDEERLAPLAEMRGGGDDDGKDEVGLARENIVSDLVRAKKEMERLDALHDDVAKYWSDASLRIVGHVVRSPPLALGVSAERYTEDYAIVQLDPAKLTRSPFRGNALDLGRHRAHRPYHFLLEMYPDAAARTAFKYPFDGLLPLRGTIPDDELRCPDARDAGGAPALPVVKSGNATGTTLGRATGVFSVVRERRADGTVHTSREWALLPCDHKSGVFTARGDSGAVVADRRGRIGGLLTGGAGGAEAIDVAYATPFWWLFERIKAGGYPDAHLDPVVV